MLFRSTLGATSISAGSKTDPGGYATYPQALEQFSVSDERTPAEVEQAVNGGEAGIEAPQDPRARAGVGAHVPLGRSEEHTSELQSRIRISYAVEFSFVDPHQTAAYLQSQLLRKCKMNCEVTTQPLSLIHI